MFYESRPQKNSEFFDSKLHTPLIIEAGFFLLAPTFRMPCILWGACTSLSSNVVIGILLRKSYDYIPNTND